MVNSSVKCSRLNNVLFIGFYLFVLINNTKWINAKQNINNQEPDGLRKELRPLNSFIKHHEPLSYNAKIVHERAKRSVDAQQNSQFNLNANNNLKDNLIENTNKDSNLVHIDFNAHGKQFNLRLFKDTDSVFSKDLIIEDPNGQKLDVNLDHIYSGYLEDEANLSKVYGHLINGVFEGKIHSKNGTFYVERAHHYNQIKKKNVHSVIYNSEDVIHPHGHHFEGGCMNEQIKDWMDKISRSAVDDDSNKYDDDKFVDIEINKLNSSNLNKYNYQLDEQLCDHNSKKTDKHIRAKRQSDFFGSNIVNNNNYHPFFSSGSSYFDSAGRILRNPQHRISLNPRDRGPFRDKPFLFHPPSPSTVDLKRRACSLFIQTDTYLWNHIRKEVDSDSKAREEVSSLGKLN